VGPDALPESEKAILETTRMIREDFLQQSAFHDVDAFCPPEKQYWMLKALIAFYDATVSALSRGVSLKQVLDLPLKEEIARIKEIPSDKAVDKIKDLISRISKDVASIEVV